MLQPPKNWLFMLTHFKKSTSLLGSRRKERTFGTKLEGTDAMKKGPWTGRSCKNQKAKHRSNSNLDTWYSTVGGVTERRLCPILLPSSLNYRTSPFILQTSWDAMVGNVLFILYRLNPISDFSCFLMFLHFTNCISFMKHIYHLA